MMTCYDDAHADDHRAAGRANRRAGCASAGASESLAPKRFRQAVAAHVGRASAVARASAFGLWRDRGIDALDYERHLREEWRRSDTASSRKSTTRKR
jgi:hypothetical protein